MRLMLLLSPKTLLILLLFNLTITKKTSVVTAVSSSSISTTTTIPLNIKPTIIVTDDYENINNNENDDGIINFHYHAIHPPRISSLSPRYGSFRGREEIILTIDSSPYDNSSKNNVGIGGTTHQNVWCRFTPDNSDNNSITTPHHDNDDNTQPSWSTTSIIRRGILTNDTTILCQTPPSPRPRTPTTTISILLSISFNRHDWSTNNPTFQYRQTPLFRSIYPSHGGEGVSISIRGDVFPLVGLASCQFLFFDLVKIASDAEWQSEEEIVCITPPPPPPVDSGTTMAAVSVTWDGDRQHNTGYYFYYTESHVIPQTFDVRPTIGGVAGDTLIRIHGRFPINDSSSSRRPTCRFDPTNTTTTAEYGPVTPATLHSSFGNETILECHTPTRHHPGKYQVMISFNGQYYHHGGKNAIFYYVHDVVIHDASPRRLFSRGEEVMLNVMGSHFIFEEEEREGDIRLACLFERRMRRDDGTFESLGGSDSSSMTMATIISKEELKCPVPPTILHNATSLILRLVITDDDNAILLRSNGMALSILPPPIISSVEFVSSIIDQNNYNNEIFVKGWNFPNDAALTCHFKDLGETPVRWLSKEEILCTIPPSENGGATSVSLRLSSSSSLSYDLHPVVINPPFSLISPGMTPTRGSISGDTIVTILLLRRYSKLLSPTYCHFDAQRVVATIISSHDYSMTKLSCHVPPVSHPSNVNVRITSDDGYFDMTVGTFHYHLPPRVMEIKPMLGGSDTTLILSGENLEFVTHCRFVRRGYERGADTKRSVIVPVSNSTPLTTNATVIKCNVPQWNHTGRLLVDAISTHDDDYDYDSHNNITSRFPFHYQPPLHLLSLYPTLGPTRGHTPLLIIGRGFIDSVSLSCRFGSHLVPARFLSSGRVQCHTPPHHVGRALVSVTNNGVDYATELVYNYHAPVHLSSLSPSVGIIGHDKMMIAITATNLPKDFVPDLSCRFDNERIDATIVYGVVYCRAPLSYEEGVVRVSLTINGVDYSEEDEGFYFRYLPQPMIDNVTIVTPQHGWSSSSDDDTVMATTVVFGINNVNTTAFPSLSCVIYNNNNQRKIMLLTTDLIDDHHIHCHIPPRRRHPSSSSSHIQPLSLHYNTDSPHPIPLPSTIYNFQYIRYNIINSLTPRSGPRMGGTKVTVLGYGFINAPDLVCSFNNDWGEVVVNATFISNRMVTCIAPSSHHADDVRHVMVSSHSMRLRTRRNQHYQKSTFQYYTTPQLYNLHPPYGSTSGNTLLTITGHHFLPTTPYTTPTCHFDSLVRLARYTSPQTITCRTPPYRPGSPRILSVGVSLNDDDVTRNEMVNFEYVTPWRVWSVTPARGGREGCTRVVLRVTTGDNEERREWENVRCIFGDGMVEAVDVVVRTMTSEEGVELLITCLTPPATNITTKNSSLSTPLITPVTISISSDQPPPSTITYTYYPSIPITITKLHPSIGFTSGFNEVLLHGRGFLIDDNDAILCRFDGRDAKVSRVTRGVVGCIVPPYPLEDDNNDGWNVNVTLSFNGGGDFVTTVHTYRYLPHPSITSFSPSIVSHSGSSIVTLKGNVVIYQAQYCKFGSHGRITPVLNQWREDSSVGVIQCRAAGVRWWTFDQDEEWEVHLSFMKDGEGMVPMGVNVIYDTPTTSSFGDDKISSLRQYQPVIQSVIPRFLSSEGYETLTIHSDRMTSFLNNNFTHCQFTSNNQNNISTVAASIINDNELTCLTPPLSQNSIATVTLITTVEEQQLSSLPYSLKVIPSIVISSIVPSFGPRGGGTIVTIIGRFPPSSNNGSCRFGGLKVSIAHVVSNDKIICAPSPSIDDGLLSDGTSVVSFGLSLDSNGSNNYGFGGSTTALSWHRGVYFRYDPPIIIHGLYPPRGPLSGNTKILIEGRNFRNETTLSCRFSGYNGMVVVIPAVFLSMDEIICHAPPMGGVENFENVIMMDVTITTNGIDYTTPYNGAIFSYHPPLVISSITPVMGPAMLSGGGRYGGGTVVHVTGRGFHSRMDLFCAFDNVVVLARYIDERTLTCISPPMVPGRYALTIRDESHDDDDVLLSTNDDVFFLYYTPPTILSLHPNHGPISGSTPLFLRISNGINTTSLSCRFVGNDDSTIRHLTRGTLIREDLLMCPTPPVSKAMTVGVTISFNAGFDDSPGRKLFHYENSLRLNAPNGTMLVTTPQQHQNFTLCHPGSFQPRTSQTTCLPCPIGFLCPDFGLSKPVICPAGYICAALGLRVPTSPCPRGHYCNEGTRTDSVTSFFDEGDDVWIRVNETGEVYTTPMRGYYPIYHRSPPATGSYYIHHPPILDRMLAEQPYPCPLGYYCLTGVVTPLPQPLNFSTPQPCHPGFFCPRGSSTPEGSGPCPTGYYCPDDRRAIICPMGFYCPGVANVKPLPCESGMFNPTAGRTECEPCPIGFICPGFMRTEPMLCPAGFVCDVTGYSIPVTPCPRGYMCAPGTMTIDPNDETGGVIKPIICESGVFCAGGVAMNLTLEEEERDMMSPRVCTEGMYCERGSGDARGSGLCWPGHYCPPGTSLPIPVPVGRFASQEGSIVPTLCFPGSYAPRKGSRKCRPCPAGFSCEGYGTSIPRICGPGTYRSFADSITCRPCPYGTFGPYSGATAPTECLPCPAGRVCPTQGLSTLSFSLPCPPGYTCGHTTSLTSIHSHPCPAGFTCSASTPPHDQYSNPCPPSFVCPRGSTFSDYTPCPAGRFCPRGTPSKEGEMLLCPRMTMTLGVGKRLRRECVVRSVDVCDKVEWNPRDEGEDVSYYPRYRYRAYDREDGSSSGEGRMIVFDSNVGLVNRTGEVMVLRKIIPWNKKTNVGSDNSDGEDMKDDVISWRNDTVEVFRSCPSYGLDISLSTTNNSNTTTTNNDNSNKKSQSSVQVVTIIGRNFRNSSKLSCRITPCLNSDWGDFDNTFPHVPRICRNANGTVTTQLLSSSSRRGQWETKAVFRSETRVDCFIPHDIASIVKMEVTKRTTTNNDDVSFRNKCRVDDDNRVYYLQKCSDEEVNSRQCDKPLDSREYQHRRIYSTAVPCSDVERMGRVCDNVPDIGMRLNPCFSGQVIVEISNNGAKFSGERTFIPHSVGLNSEIYNKYKHHDIPGTYAIYTYLSPTFSQSLFNITTTPSSQLYHFLNVSQTDHLQCLIPVYREEGPRPRSTGWFSLPFLSQAHLSFDWRHLPSDLTYDDHFKLAIYVQPSRCGNSKCDNNRLREAADEERLPCRQPVPLPPWFVDPRVDKRQIMNVTLTALDDVIFKVEVHIVHGLYIASADFFLDTMTVDITSPSRARIPTDRHLLFGPPKREQRLSSPHVSWEETPIDMTYTFGIVYTAEDARTVVPPLNMPPRWEDFAHGRVLVSMNATMKNEEVISVRDDVEEKRRVSSRFWDNPFSNPSAAKEVTDTFFETFHGVTTTTTASSSVNGEEEESSQQSFGYELDSVMLPYLPFFSNCREFDSHIAFWAMIEDGERCELPEVDEVYSMDWWRREFPPLPHRDDIYAVGPFDFMRFYPVADWCERKIFCEYEEDLEQPDVIPRWFEVGSGVSLFSVIRDPVNYYEYTGRAASRVGADDGGGQKFINSIQSYDTFIPVKVDRSAADDVDDGCANLCFPRSITMNILYYQRDRHTKRIVDISLVYDSFDKDNTKRDYEMQIIYRPLDYRELIIKFAYSKEIFLLLFSLIGVFTVLTAFFYWGIVRITTRIEHPPKIRFFGMFGLIFPQALGGFLMGMIPIALVTAVVTYFTKGYVLWGETGEEWPIFGDTPLHFMDGHKIDPNKVFTTRQGRFGLSFVAIGAMCIIEGSKIFLPTRESKREEELIRKRDRMAEKQSIWTPNRWKRSNFCFVSFVMGLFLVIIVEWSYWEDFGTYIWEAIIALKIANILVSNVVDNQLNDALLSSPVMTAMGLVQGLVTLSASDFMDFLLSYIVEFGFLILERMYTDPYQSTFLDWVNEKLAFLAIQSKIIVQKALKIHDKTQQLEEPENSLVVDSSETVEPILDSYGSYCCDTMSLLYTPFIIVLLMIFREETGIPMIYGIKEQDMAYYLFFALVIIPFQILSDIYIHASLELFHGWKIYDYLVYTQYRFMQREARWKGLEDSLDECIDESMRTLDQMCFSSQFYMMTTIHVNGIVYFVLGVEMMIRSKYNMFGDPAIPLLVPLVVVCTIVIKKVLLWVAIKIGIWKIRHENTAWHAAMRNEEDFDVSELDDVKGANHDAYMMNQRITSDTFRYKFLNYNRSWLIDQLPSMLTPRTLRRSRPYLINQFTKVLNSLNKDISSDSEADEGPQFDSVPTLNAPSRKLLRWWLSQAQRRLKLKEVVQPLIQKARGNHCEVCLSKKLLQIETKINLEEMDEKFSREHPNDDMDMVLWKIFWKKHQKYCTICLPCISERKEKKTPSTTGFGTSSKKTDYPEWGAVHLSASSRAILMGWYDTAQGRIFGKNGRNRKRVPIDYSDDETDAVMPLKWAQEEFTLNESSKVIAVKWLRTARAKLQRERGWGDDVLPSRRLRKKRGGYRKN